MLTKKNHLIANLVNMNEPMLATNFEPDRKSQKKIMHLIFDFKQPKMAADCNRIVSLQRQKLAAGSTSD